MGLGNVPVRHFFQRVERPIASISQTSKSVNNKRARDIFNEAHLWKFNEFGIIWRSPFLKFPDQDRPERGIDWRR